MIPLRQIISLLSKIIFVRYFFHIGYKGTAYKGWQRQNNVKGIQEVLEDYLSKLLKEKVNCIGCGRTDAGVHASQYYFHINTQKAWNDSLLYPLNKILPSDISVYDVFEVDSNNHCQFSATSRTYDYFIHTQRIPFLNDISSYYDIKPDAKLMSNAASLLLKYSDFRAFCKSPDRHNHTLCDLISIHFFSNKDQTKFRLQITANRFLKGMIRILVYELIEVGIGLKSISEFEDMIQNRIAPKFLNSAYPQGLYLSQINYPFISLKNNLNNCPMMNIDQWTLIEAN